MSRWPAFLALLAIFTTTAEAFCADPGVQSGLVRTQTEQVNEPGPAKKRPVVGLALGGGGARGAAHVSVLRALQAEGVPIDLVAGTSIGAVVGGLYCAGVSLDVLERKFHDASLMKAFMTVPLAVRIVASPILVMPRLIGSHPYDGLYKGNKFRNYLEHSVPPCDRNIEDLKIPFAAVALDIVDGKVYRLTRGNLGYALQASSAVPGLRKPVQIGEQLFVDGGVFANVPTKQVREMGADIVIAVNVDERIKPAPLNDFRKVGSVTKRIIQLQLGELGQASDSDADFVIHPNVDGIGLISTSKKDAKKALEAGQIAAREAIPQIKRKLQELGVSLNPPTSPTAASSAAVE